MSGKRGSQHVAQVDRATGTARGTHLLIPTGTQVVSRVEVRDAAGAVTCPLGAAGVVVRAPEDATRAYRVRLADGREVSLKRRGLSIAKHAQRDDFEAAAGVLDDHDLYAHVIYRCVLGSHAHGLAHAASGVDRLEVDLVTHEARKFFRLLLRHNGYVLEQVTSPLVVHTTPAHAELVALARGCVTRACARHYLGFAQNQWALFDEERPRRVKPLLYVPRVLLTGTPLMRTGAVTASLVACNDALDAAERLPYVEALVAREAAGGEHGALGDADVAFYEREYHRLRARLVVSAERSTLPEAPTAAEGLKDLLRRVRRAAPAVA